MSVELFSLVVALGNLLIVLELVRRRQMMENFALLWSSVAIGGFVLVLARPLIDQLTQFVGLDTGTSLVFAGAIAFLLVVCMYLSLQVSRLTRRVELLAEEISFLNGVEDPTGPAAEAPTE